jgi:DUF3014 family protein
MQSRVIMAVVAIIVVGIGAGLWWWQSAHTPVSKVASVPSAQPPPAQPVEEGETPATPEVQRQVLPPLDASDDYVREQVSVVSPEMTEWLKQDDLVRRFAVVVDNARLGDYPRRQLAFLAPSSKFPVLQQDDHLVVDPEGYHRYDHLVDVAISMDPKRAVAMLRTLSPLLESALKELGQTNPDPMVSIRDAIDIALETPVVTGDIQLVQPKVAYEYADPKLEALKPLQKQLLRMGPQNVARLKSYLTQVRSNL